MTTQTGITFHVLQKGATQEEPWEWSDIVDMCEAGRFSPDSMIFMPEEDCWKKMGDTELAALFDPKTQGGEEPAEEDEDDTELRAQYEDVLEQIEESPASWTIVLHAAELASALGDHEAAKKHLQRALDRSPYHPRIVQVAGRILPPAERKALRFLERVEPIWEDPLGLLGYALGRGPLYIAIPAVVLCALTWIPWLNIFVAAVAFLWMTEAIRASAAREKRPPLWHGFLRDPVRALVRPALAAAVLAVELYLPVFLAAEILVRTGVIDQTSGFAFIQSSPFMSVILFTVSLLWVPAVLMLAAASTCSIKEIFSPKRVVAKIARLEREYVASLAVILPLVGLLAGAWVVCRMIPFVGDIVTMAAAVYVLLTGGLVLGRLYSRFGQLLDVQTPSASDLE
jgi:hypothetical protein